MASWTDADWKEALAELSRRAAVDPEFRKLALKDANAALAKVTTRSIPTNFSFRFVDNSGSMKTIPLPDPIAEIEELTDVELEGVAGGNVTVSGAWSR